MNTFKYLNGYPEPLKAQVQALIERDQLGAYLHNRYPDRHAINTDKSLYQYVVDIKQRFLKNAPPINKVLFDSKLDVIHNALGLHTARSMNHGGRLKAQKEIRVASVFKEVPPEFLQMIVVHELAHLREFEHNKAFYQLCEHMQPGYRQYEFDLRLYLTWKDLEA